MRSTLLIPAICAAVLGIGPSAAGQRAIEFRADVLPILEDRCYQCHRAAYVDEGGRTRKPKGGLRLDGAGWIAKGGDEGSVVSGGQPAKSSLYTRVVLPEDDDDRMPQKGDPLTKAQADVLREWIAGGADFGDWTGEPGGVATAVAEAESVAPYVQLLERLGQDARPASAAALAKARGKVAQISPAQPGSALLRVEYVSHEANVTDREVQVLGPVRSLVTHLNLGRTKITDRALAVVGDMPRLTRLDLRTTDVTDRGLRALAGLRELRYLNLYGTAVTDAGLAALGQLPELEAVYLWGTQVTESGVADLRERFPGARVHHQVVLPEVRQRPDAEESRKRRRRR